MEGASQAEQHYFRKAVTNASIQDGRLETAEYVFYPYQRGRLAFESEADLIKSVPTYFERSLRPHRDALEGRSTVAKRGKPWWTLAEQRAFETGGKPRVISKYFGGIGGFAFDPGSDVAVVQGYSWYPEVGLLRASKAALSDAPGLVSPGFVAAYGALFNTRLFATLLDAFSAPVSGGQYDLSKRYVDAINLPDFAVLFADSRTKATIMDLERLGAAMRPTEPRWAAAADTAALASYGLDLSGFVTP